jgi:hypothetical protein
VKCAQALKIAPTLNTQKGAAMKTREEVALQVLPSLIQNNRGQIDNYVCIEKIVDISFRYADVFIKKSGSEKVPKCTHEATIEL